VPGLAHLSVLNVASVLAFLGIAVEIGMGKLRSLWTPQLPLLAGFCAWLVVATTVKVGFGEVTGSRVWFSVLFMLLVMYSLATFERLRAMMVLLLAIAIFLSSAGAQQATTPFECILLEKDENGLTSTDLSIGEPIGLACENHRDCVNQTKNYRDDFLCERPGPFNTFTIGEGRVRWRGIMADPNELSLGIGAAVSFAFALHAVWRRKWRHLFLLATVGLATYCVILTGSRGGVLVILAIFAAYFVRQFGAKGLVLAMLFGAPAILLGGRTGEEAESSSLERLGALYEGVDFVRASPIFGLGCGQFTENYFITAHNSYLLAAAELGFPGLFLWSLLVYVSVKIPLAVSTNPPPDLDPRFKPYAFALATSFAGILVGILFLSFCYHAMLFIYFGLSGGLYLAAKRSSPTFDVKLRPIEAGAVAAVDVVLLTGLFVYTRIMGAP
jgi:O-antigen ligase